MSQLMFFTPRFALRAFILLVLSGPAVRADAVTDAQAAILARIKPPQFAECDFPITDFGAVADGDCTPALAHGVSIGSGTKGGVSNFTVTDCTFKGTDCGIRIKSDRDRGGVVSNLAFRNLRMTDVGCPILIYGAYMATGKEFRDLTSSLLKSPRPIRRLPSPSARRFIATSFSATSRRPRKAERARA